jgi:predicted RNase H-like nuclease (RuvC/YqgF family)
MSTETPTGNESPVTTAEAVESFVSTVADTLNEADVLDDDLTAIREASSQLVEDTKQIETLAAENSKLREQNEQLRRVNNVLRQKLMEARDQ